MIDKVHHNDLQKGDPKGKHDQKDKHGHAANGKAVGVRSELLVRERIEYRPCEEHNRPNHGADQGALDNCSKTCAAARPRMWAHFETSAVGGAGYLSSIGGSLVGF